MTGFVRNDLNSQSQKPKGAGYYAQGDEIAIVDAEYRNGNHLWYKTADDVWVIAGQVETVRFSELSGRDAEQFFMCYRSLADNGDPVTDDETDMPSRLYFSVFSRSDLLMEPWTPVEFANRVVASVAGDPREHVVIYMHGFDWEPGLKLDLGARFAASYLTHLDNSIAKVLYFGWPSYGERGTADDRTLALGQNFTSRGMFAYFFALKERLAAVNKKLNLMVHSFGHVLLNSMINPLPLLPDPARGKLFENIFLMAPDICHLALQPAGVRLRNRTLGGAPTHFYNYMPLINIAGRIHVYYDRYDYLLYLSTKKSVGARGSFQFETLPDAGGITHDFRMLGNYGDEILVSEGVEISSAFVFQDVNALDSADQDGIPMIYAGLSLRGSNFETYTNMARDQSDYSKIGGLGRLARNGLVLTSHHQYMLSNKSVVEDVLRKLRN